MAKLLRFTCVLPETAEREIELCMALGALEYKARTLLTALDEPLTRETTIKELSGLLEDAIEV